MRWFSGRSVTSFLVHPLAHNKWWWWWWSLVVVVHLNWTFFLSMDDERDCGQWLRCCSLYARCVNMIIFVRAPLTIPVPNGVHVYNNNNCGEMLIYFRPVISYGCLSILKNSSSINSYCWITSLLRVCMWIFIVFISRIKLYQCDQAGHEWQCQSSTTAIDLVGQ